MQASRHFHRILPIHSTLPGMIAGMSQWPAATWLFGLAGAALASLWLALLPVWLATFTHRLAGAGLQILIIVCVATLAWGAWRSLSHAYNSLVQAKRSGLQAGGRASQTAAMACRPAGGWHTGQRRVAAPAACQREPLAADWR